VRQYRRILRLVLLLPQLFVLLLVCIVLNDLQSEVQFRIGPLDCDNPEHLLFLAQRNGVFKKNGISGEKYKKHSFFFRKM
jgi:ABC-type nitrate/sulfonate/bicarbonate transport system substrate-binding protein